MPQQSAAGAWTDWYATLGLTAPRSFDDPLTYHLAADFLKGCALVEDWGCGLGFMRTLIPKVRYRGIDGSASPFVDELVDLAEYRSHADGIFMRHVLEHNYSWRQILDNALASFRRRMALVIFTPFQDRTEVLTVGRNVVVPDIAFAESDLTARFGSLRWREETHATRTQYGTETIFFLQR